MNDNGYDLGELVKFIENMKNLTKEIIEKIKDKFYLSFESRPEDYKLSGMIVIGEAGIIGKRLHETFPKHFFKSNGEDAWLSDFEGVVCSNGLILLSPGNIYTEFPEPLLDKLTEVSEWLKERECSADSFDWEKFIKTPEYKDMFNTWIARTDEWIDYNNILNSPVNSTTNTYTSNNISNTVTSASTDISNNLTICTNSITNTSLDTTGASNCKN